VPARAGQRLDARSEIEGEATVIMLLPEGTRVKKKQLVCELDTADVRDRLAIQHQLDTERAKSTYMTASEAYEMAQVELESYERGTVREEEAAIRGEIEVAQAALELEQARLAAIDPGSELKRMEGDLAVKRAEMGRQRAQSKQRHLQHYTHPSRVMALKNEVEKAKRTMLLAETEFKLQTEQEQRLERMVEKGKVFAPANGVVVYARLGPGQGAGKVAEGSVVREGQALFQIEVEPIRGTPGGE
jgi:biotin carboxyl carrier protein